MTVKKVEIVSLTIPEWDLLSKISQLLVEIATSTDKNMPISQKAMEAARALEVLADEIDKTCGC